MDAHKGAALVVGANTADAGTVMPVAALCRSLMQRGAALRAELPASKVRAVPEYFHDQVWLLLSSATCLPACLPASLRTVPKQSLLTTRAVCCRQPLPAGLAPWGMQCSQESRTVCTTACPVALFCAPAWQRLCGCCITHLHTAPARATMSN